MSDTPPASFEWGGEHFCQPDATDLYYSEPQRLQSIGFPKQMHETPETFCAVCLLWFTNPEHDTKEHP